MKEDCLSGTLEITLQMVHQICLLLKASKMGFQSFSKQTFIFPRKGF